MLGEKIRMETWMAGDFDKAFTVRDGKIKEERRRGNNIGLLRMRLWEGHLLGE